MPTICPNCLRPVRVGAKYCGFCGTNLNPTAQDAGPAVVPATLEGEPALENLTAPPQTKPRGGKTRRTVLMVIILLLCIVLLVAFSAYYLRLIG
jgi:hypothetical protein